EGRQIDLERRLGRGRVLGARQEQCRQGQRQAGEEDFELHERGRASGHNNHAHGSTQTGAAQKPLILNRLVMLSLLLMRTMASPRRLAMLRAVMGRPGGSLGIELVMMSSWISPPFNRS